MHFLAEAGFVHPMDDDDAASGNGSTKPTRHISGYFHTHPVHVSAAHEPQLLDFSSVISELNKAVDQFTCRGSGYVLTCVAKLTVVMVPFRPLSGDPTSQHPVGSPINMPLSMSKTFATTCVSCGPC